MKPQPIQTEFQKRLHAAIEAWRRALAEVTSYQQLHDEAKEELTAFATTGDLRDLQAVAAVLPRQMQATLSERRIALASEAAETVEQQIAEEVTVAKATLLQAINRASCGLVERAARSMREHFDDLQAARRQAFSSTAVKEMNAIAHRIENLSLSLDPAPSAEELLRIAPAIFAQVASLEKELGEIPSEGELRAP